MTTNKEVLPIIFCINNEYSKQTAALILSICSNSKNTGYKFYILHSSVDDKNQNLLKQTVAQCSPDAQIEFIDLRKYTDSSFVKKYMGHNKSLDYISIETCYRLFIPEIFKQYDKVLYLDSDMTAIKDISPLKDIDITDYYAGVVEGFGVKNLIGKNIKVNTYPEYNWEQYLEKKLNKKTLKYFNAGFLLLNLKLLRRDNVQEKMFNFLEKESPLEYLDQDVLNAVFEDKVKYLPEKYNMFPGIADEETVILHFIGKEKPWNYYKSNEYFEEYWKYLKLTPFWNKETEEQYNKFKSKYFVYKFFNCEVFKIRQDERHYKIKFLFIHLTINKKWLKFF